MPVELECHSHGGGDTGTCSATDGSDLSAWAGRRGGEGWLGSVIHVLQLGLASIAALLRIYCSHSDNCHQLEI